VTRIQGVGNALKPGRFLDEVYVYRPDGTPAAAG
jgi:hypothetical protein